MFLTYVHDHHNKWPEYVSFIEKCLHFSIHDTTNCIPYELMYNKKCPLRYENLVEFLANVQINFDDKMIIVQNNLKIKAKAREELYDKGVKLIKYEINDLVFVKNYYLSSCIKNEINKFFLLYRCPYKVLDIKL